MKYVGKQTDGEYLIESVEHTLDMQEGFITKCHLIRNFCEVSNRSGTASEEGRIILVVLMLTGGSPGSTAGGIKTTTAFTLAATAAASLRMRADVECFSRRLAPETRQQALTIFLLYLMDKAT